jgi:hypothetical protein
MIKTATIILPSTLQLEIRQLKVAEENELAKARRAVRKKQEKLINQTLSNCTLSVIDPGPYEFLKADGRMEPHHWKKVISADRVSMMLGVHKVSYRDGEWLNVDKIKCRGCKNIYGWRIKIDEDLIHRPLPDESIECLMDDGLFKISVNDHTIVFVLGTGESEEKYDKFAKQWNNDRDVTAGLRSRIIDVVTPEGEKIDRSKISDWIDGGKKGDYVGLTSEEAEDIRDAMDQVDGGYDLEVEAHCPDCGEMESFDVPFDAIFAPGSSIRDRRRARRGRASLEG